MEKNKTEKANITLPIAILLTLYLAVVFNRDFASIRPIWFGINGLLILSLVVKTRTLKNVYISGFSKWFGIFLLFCIASIFWTNSIENSLYVLKTVVLFFVVTFFLSLFILNNEDIKVIIICICCACFITALYIFVKMGFTLISDVRIGLDTLGEGWNANGVGLMTAIGAVSSFFLIENANRMRKWVLIFSIVFFSILNIFTGSRVAVVLLILALCSFVLLSKRKNKQVTILILSLIIVSSILLLFSNETLYSILGRRLEAMVRGFFGEGTDEGSFNVRQNMISAGLKYFSQKPILGHGINGFRLLYGDEFSFYTYAHNNFVELLVDVGLIGFIIYYSAYVYLLCSLYKVWKATKDNLAAFLFSLILVYTITHYALVAYDSFLNNIFLMLAFTYTKRHNKKSIRGSFDV